MDGRALSGGARNRRTRGATGQSFRKQVSEADQILVSGRERLMSCAMIQSGQSWQSGIFMALLCRSFRRL
jgi:hypothetical protein